MQANQALVNKNTKTNTSQVTSVAGVKGPCYLAKLMPDYIMGMAIDPMHAIYEGVFKKLLVLWLDSSYSSFPFSLRVVIGEINSLIFKIKPPKFVHMMPRSIDQYNNWKASELKNFMLYYSAPILEEFMRPDYFKHYLLFLQATAILSKNSVSDKDIQDAKLLIKKFVKEFESDEYYGIRFCSLNIHQILHLPDNVRTLGPLWTNSCFPFEDINGQLVKNVHGTTDVESQISSRHLQVLSFSGKVSKLKDGPVRDFLEKHKTHVKIIESIGDCKPVGKYKKIKDLPDKIDWTHIGEDVANFSIWQYYRLLKNGILYISDSYKSDIKTNSFTQFIFKGKICFGKILYFLKTNFMFLRER